MRETLRIKQTDHHLRAGDRFEFAVFGTNSGGEGFITRKGHIYLQFDEDGTKTYRPEIIPMRTFKRLLYAHESSPDVIIWV